MTMFLAYVCIQVGCLLLSLAYRVHYRRLFHVNALGAARRTLMLCSGFVALAAGLYLCNRVSSIGVAITTFFGLLTPAICVVAMLLAWQRQRLNRELKLERGTQGQR